ncbi:DUF3604 domain-containing protein [Seongchinamella sediminis]|uniref:DUF3604 domain-containing protein n=2 Tax=Seongchinamella sediminis TaxID=2283635 RepID=A0A3L7E220_9GAMM|nr:DUF3604 domain-containing protein [Seongchinamella sediminis]
MSALTATLLCAPGALAAEAAGTQLYWGDTHLHTSNSFDVYLFNTPTSTPDTALRFARGLPVVSPTTQTRWQLSVPLDFAVVSDHAELLGSIPRMFRGDEDIVGTKAGSALRKLGGEESEEELQAIYDEVVSVGSGLGSKLGLTPGDLIAGLHAGDKRRPAWEANIDTVEHHNTPGEFTAFIGWEWSAQPKAGNLHRVVFTPQGGDVARQFLPYSSLESGDPRDLWAWLEETQQRTGADFVAIPHNGNISMGQMFPLVDQDGDPLDAEYARAREKWERVIEITQIKGDSETHPLLSPTDEFADFETFPFVLTPDGRTPDPTEGDYVRAAFKRGLAWEEQLGVNPFKAGVIGSTDSHTGMSAAEEDNFAGKGQHDSRPGLRPKLTGIGGSRGWDMGAAGYAAVWATENSRQAIFEAFQRREVYATTGPRITLRFFGGFAFEQADTRARDLAGTGYRKGVPMGGDLAGSDDQAPGFLVAAFKDPNGANLDRVQIVKGWLREDGTTAEKVYDVALSDGRADGAVMVGNTVDLETGSYSNSIGASDFTVLWKDPDFDPAQRAFYYARVLEIPTPRHSLLDAIALGLDVAETGHPATIQERVYSSPIWYTP